MTPRNLVGSAALGLFLAGVLPTQGFAAEPVTITLDAALDTSIYEESGTLSNGAGKFLFAGKTLIEMRRRALLAFDIAGNIPGDSTIQAVTLTLNTSKEPEDAEPVTFSLHALSHAWGEGSSDAGDPGGLGTNATAGDATWDASDYQPAGTTILWGTTGGDYDPSSSADLSVNGTGPCTATGPGLVADVQGWLDAPSSNHGLILIGDEATLKSARRFDSRENDLEDGAPPTLEITYVPEPDRFTMSSASLLLLIGLGLLHRWQRAGVPRAHASISKTVALLVLGVLCGLPEAASGDLEPIEIVEAFPSLTFTSPVFLTAPADGSDRIFVVERRGRILVFNNGSNVSTSKIFLNIGSIVLAGGEQGLLGLAFDPDYASNGYFYVNYTASENCATARCTKIVRYSVDESDPDVAISTSALVLLEIDQPRSNHNGGMIAFSPADDMLYIGMGDGGGGGDPDEEGQNKETLLGAMLRIDPRCPQGNCIPADNPFADAAGTVVPGADEIWHYGLRNPWRFSFDRKPPHDLWIGDVGQGAWEEIDFSTSGQSGLNFGWDSCEGAHAFYPSEESDCMAGNGLGYVLPSIEHPTTGWHSITGGYIYRGKRVPALEGYYVYADYEGPRKIYAWDRVTLDLDTGLGAPEVIGSDFVEIASFGEDEAGELYIVSLGGTIYQLPEPRLPLLQLVMLALLACLRGYHGSWKASWYLTPLRCRVRPSAI